MFIAMNRFRVAKGSEAAFEHVWLSRDSHLDKVPGFVEFRPLKGSEAEDHTLYASHTVWKTRAAFEAWTQSEAFRAAHHRAGENKPLYLGHPSICGGSPGISGGGSLAGFGVGSVNGCGGSKVGSPGGSCIGLSGGSRSGGAIGSWSGFVGLPGVADMGTYLEHRIARRRAGRLDDVAGCRQGTPRRDGASKKTDRALAEGVQY